MFTPQKKLWSGWPMTPRTEPGRKNGSGSGKDPSPSEVVAKGSENFEGMDKEALLDRIVKLEGELFEYQYNMGLLLIEKKEWSSKHEELMQSLAEVDSTYKREQAAHLMAISEVEKREENLKKALGVEKQCVLDLEKALREMRSEYAEIKFTADSKLNEANALVSCVEEKSLEVEAKLHSADAKLAEASRRSSELERKLVELEVQENALRDERASFYSEREKQENALMKQRENLRESETKLKEGEVRLAEAQKMLNQREQRANETDLILKKKESEVEDAQKKLDAASLTLKQKEEEIENRLASLVLKEKEADLMKNSLETKESQLLELEEKLNARERMEIQKLTEEHKRILDEKSREFELEMEQKRKSVDEDLKSKVDDLDRKEAEINHMEEKVRKREQTLDKKLEKLKEREKDLESKSKSLKEREKSLRVEEKNLDKERREVLADKENLLALKVELENMKADIEKQQIKINEDMEHLRVTEEERSEYDRLQSELKLEIEKCRLQSELMTKEAEDLKHDREKFEKEWEELDEKRAEITKDLQDLIEQKKNWEKLKHSEEERLKNEKLETENYVQRESEALRVAKDSFATSMQQERSMLTEKIQNERSQMLHDFDMQKRELETELQQKQEEMESRLREREKLFEEEKDRELNNINYLREVVQREMGEINLSRAEIDKEKEEIFSNKKNLESQQLEMRKDIDELVSLSRKLKEQREQLLKERKHFIAFVEKQQSCNTCKELIREFVLSDLTETDNVEGTPLPKVAEVYLKEDAPGTSKRQNTELSPASAYAESPASGGMSWLRRCTTRIFKFSAGKKIDLSTAEDGANGESLQEKAINEGSKVLVTENEVELSNGVANDSSNIQRIQSDSSMREMEATQGVFVNDQSNISEKVQDTPENSQVSDGNVRSRRAGKRGRPRGGRTRSVRGVNADSKHMLTGSIENGGEHINGNADSSIHMDEGSLESRPTNARKRTRAQTSQSTATGHDAADDDGHSDGTVVEGRRKRRPRVAPAVQTPGEKRYNLRRPKTVSAAKVNGSVPDLSKGKEKEADGWGSHGEAGPAMGAMLSENDEVGKYSRDEVLDSDAAQVAPLRVAGEDDGPVRSIEAVHEIYAESLTKQFIRDAVDSEDRNAEADNNADDVVLNNEDEIATPDGSRDYKSETPVDDNEEEEYEDEVDHPGEVSTVKKIWKFITT